MSDPRWGRVERDPQGRIHLTYGEPSATDPEPPSEHDGWTTWALIYNPEGASVSLTDILDHRG